MGQDADERTDETMGWTRDGVKRGVAVVGCWFLMALAALFSYSDIVAWFLRHDADPTKARWMPALIDGLAGVAMAQASASSTSRAGHRGAWGVVAVASGLSLFFNIDAGATTGDKISGAMAVVCFAAAKVLISVSGSGHDRDRQPVLTPTTTILKLPLTNLEAPRSSASSSTNIDAQPSVTLSALSTTLSARRPSASSSTNIDAQPPSAKLSAGLEAPRSSASSSTNIDAQPPSTTRQRGPGLRSLTDAELVSRASSVGLTPKGRGHVTREIKRRAREAEVSSAMTGLTTELQTVLGTGHE